TALTRLNIVVLAPMPKASVRIATAVNPGLFASIRSPKRRSWISVLTTHLQTQDPGITRGFRIPKPDPRVPGLLISQGHHGIDLRRAARGHQSCDESTGCKGDDRQAKDHRVVALDAIKLGGE